MSNTCWCNASAVGEAMTAFTGGGGQAGDGEMKTQIGWRDARGGKIDTTSPFLPCTTPISLTTPPSHSPLQKVLVNNSNLNVLFCFFSICSEASNDDPPPSVLSWCSNKREQGRTIDYWRRSHRLLKPTMRTFLSTVPCCQCRWGLWDIRITLRKR